jgi:hypothetical protein
MCMVYAHTRMVYILCAPLDNERVNLVRLKRTGNTPILGHTGYDRILRSHFLYDYIYNLYTVAPRKKGFEKPHRRTVLKREQEHTPILGHTGTIEYLHLCDCQCDIEKARWYKKCVYYEDTNHINYGSGLVGVLDSSCPLSLVASA